VPAIPGGASQMRKNHPSDKNYDGFDKKATNTLRYG
jgi:hypothetical protein